MTDRLKKCMDAASLSACSEISFVAQYYLGKKGGKVEIHD